MLIPDSFGILTLLQVLNAENVGILTLFQALIADNFGIFNRLGENKDHPGLESMTSGYATNWMRHQFSETLV